MRRKGFTLIELMIVIAIIAIIAAIAIPGLLRARISANEGSAVGTLRTISTSQAQFQSSANVDQDADGFGEFALLGELAGTRATRDSGTVADPAYITKALQPSTQTPFAGNKSGYYFKMYLPGSTTGTATTPVTDTVAVAENTSVANNQETKWRCYAWPLSAGTSGNKCFVIDQSAEGYACANVDTSTGDPLYDNAALPAFDAATSNPTDGADDDDFTLNVEKGVTNDGQTWKPAS